MRRELIAEAVVCPVSALMVSATITRLTWIAAEDAFPVRMEDPVCWIQTAYPGGVMRAHAGHQPAVMISRVLEREESIAEDPVYRVTALTVW